MKKFLILFFCCCAALSACSRKAAIQFGKAFQDAVASGDQALISQLYPAVTAADSLVFTFNEDSLKTRRIKDTVVASYSSHQDVWLVKSDDMFKAVKSRGLFAYPAEQWKMARALGQYEPVFSDRENALRMSDLGYERFLKDYYFPDNVYPLQIGDFRLVREPAYMLDSGYGYLPIMNFSDKTVRAEDYEFAFTSGYIGMGGNFETPASWPGKEIEPDGKAEYKITFTGHDYITDWYIKYNHSDAEMLELFYEPDGEEYDRFTSEFGALSQSPLPDVPKGRKILSGKIGKYAVNGVFVFEGNHFSGEYGYRGKKKGIIVEGQLRTDHFFTAQERNEKGKDSGSYYGHFTPDSLTGMFLNVKGEDFPIQLVLTDEE